MIQNKFVFILLAVLLLIKFAYIPWSEWVEEQQQTNAQLAAFYDKQNSTINNKNELDRKFKEQNEGLKNFKSLVPKLKRDEKANALWFSLIESIKDDELRVYNQKVDFEQMVTKDIGFITGTVSISGNATKVLKAVLNLEAQAPVVFLDKMNLNQTGKANKNIFVAQLYIGYWFTHETVEKND